MSQLSRLTGPDRFNARLLELIAGRDPAAVARLLALANSSAYSRPEDKAVSRLSEAIARISCKTAYSSLMDMWGAPGETLDHRCVATRERFTRHTFVVVGTLRNLLQWLELSYLPEWGIMQLHVLLNRLSLSLMFQPSFPDAGLRSLIAEMLSCERHCFSFKSEFAPLFPASESLASAWGVSNYGESRLGHFPLPAEEESPLASALRMTEALIHDAHHANEPVDRLYPDWRDRPVLKPLSSRELDYSRIVFRL